MPAGPGDTVLTTLYGDVHYHFSDPVSRPQHHRFDRGSYVYLINSSAHKTAKVEVANHAGTPYQDACEGLIDLARVKYSYKQPAVVTFTVDKDTADDQRHWHLPNWDEKNEARHLYKIHTMDVYFWTEKDAGTFLNHLKRTVAGDRLDIRDGPAATLSPHSEHRDSMSPVVQQLEKTAIGSSFPARTGSSTSEHSFPGPPTPATGSIASSQPHGASPAAMAYNPAAPAAPEPIAYREKTPPPPDAASGTGLLAAEKHDNPAQYASYPQRTAGYQPGQLTPGQGSFPGLPTGGYLQRTSSGALPPPPPPPGGPPPQHLQQQHYFSGSPQPQTTGVPTSPPPTQQSFQYSQSLGAPQTQYASFGPQSPGFGPSLTSPGLGPATPGFQQRQQQPSTPGLAPSQNHGFTPAQQQSQHSQPGQQQQTFAYSNYSYGAQQASQSEQASSGGGYTGSIHSQVYRPTDAESGGHGGQSSRAQQQQASQAQLQQSGYPGAGGPQQVAGAPSGRGKIEERVGKVEKGVGKFLKKLDSKW